MTDPKYPTRRFEKFEFTNGWAWVHARPFCDGTYCPIHHPSPHAMVEEPMILRVSTLIERLCRHGVGHPDPDSVGFFARHGVAGMETHGCDGCCTKLNR
jgi:hypothetical protein